MNIELIANLSYILSAIFFYFFGLKMLGSPATARRGNFLSSLGMLIAIVAGLTSQGIVDFKMIAGGIFIGAIIGIPRGQTSCNDLNARNGSSF